MDLKVISLLFLSVLLVGCAEPVKCEKYENVCTYSSWIGKTSYTYDVSCDDARATKISNKCVSYEKERIGNYTSVLLEI